MGKAGAKAGAVLTMLNCVECGAVFQWMPKAKGRIAMYCSKDCGIRSRNKTYRKTYRKTCAACGKEWETINKQSRCCSQRCGHELRRVDRRRVCKGCGKQWEVRDTRYDTYCSRECAFEHRPAPFSSPQSRQRRVLRNISNALKKWRRCELCRRAFHKVSGMTNKVRRCSDCRAPAGMASLGWIGPGSKVCRVCQKWINYRACVCKAHRKKKDKQTERYRRRARKRGVKIDKGITLQRVAERDGDRCYLCMELVEWLSHYTDDRYPSVDHVIPLVDGGGHTWENVRLAHRLCNSIKGDRRGDGYLDYLPHLSTGYLDPLDPQPH